MSCSLLLVKRSSPLSQRIVQRFSASPHHPLPSFLSLSLYLFSLNAHRPILSISLVTCARGTLYAERLWVNALASAINSSFECLKCRVGKLHPVTCARGWLRNATAAGNAFHDGNHRRSYASSETLRDLFLVFFQIIAFSQNNKKQYDSCDY